ncbi:MAG: hypothetical protein M1820_002827 [Bogoriella megaspora]|nr:MAG: hypothetical protein M1820_002827 [Bogoriella megaspora]
MSSITITSIPRMSRETLSALILKQATSQAQDFVVVDVRDSDHVGGHVRGSLHVPSTSLDYRVPELVRSFKDKDSVIFHCSLSQQRGPSAALRYARERKRLLGIDLGDEHVGQEGTDKEQGTAGTQQKIYVLDGGFVSWQEKFGEDEKLTEGYQKDIWEFGC